MEKVSKPPRCKNVIELLEWIDLSSTFVMVMERPMPCVDLYEYCKSHAKCQLPEYKARELIRQLVKALQHCFNCGVLHEDIRLSNILVNKETLEVKLIDFGCAKVLEMSLIPEGQFRADTGHNQRSTVENVLIMWLMDVSLFLFFSS